MMTLAAGILAGTVTALAPAPAPGDREARAALEQCHRAAVQACTPGDSGCSDAAAAVCQQLFGDLDGTRARAGANLRRRVIGIAHRLR